MSEQEPNSSIPDEPGSTQPTAVVPNDEQTKKHSQERTGPERPESPGPVDTELTQSKFIVAENDKVQEEIPVSLQTPVSEHNSTPPPPPTSSTLQEADRVGLARKISSEGKQNLVGGGKHVEVVSTPTTPPLNTHTQETTGTSSTGNQEAEPSSSTTPKRRRPKSAISSSSLGIVDDNTPVRGEVLDFHSSEVVTRRLTFPSKLIFSRPHIPYQEGWAFQKVFHEEDLMASGFLFLELNGKKPVKHTKNNTYMMLVLEGAVAVEIHRTTYVLCPGSSFHLPRGNTYSISNISNRDAKLFFVQAVQPTPLSAPSTSPYSFFSSRNDSLLTHLKLLSKPTTKLTMLVHWLIPRLISRYLELHQWWGIWYEKYLKKYEKYFLEGRRGYWMCFVLGLMIRRMPFVGSPPILNIQLVSARRR